MCHAFQYGWFDGDVPVAFGVVPCTLDVSAATATYVGSAVESYFISGDAQATAGGMLTAESTILAGLCDPPW